MWSKRQVSRELHNKEDVLADGRRNAIGKTLNDDKVCILRTAALGQIGKSKFSRGWNGKICYQEMSVGLHQQCSVSQQQLTHMYVCTSVYSCVLVHFSWNLKLKDLFDFLKMLPWYHWSFRKLTQRIFFFNSFIFILKFPDLKPDLKCYYLIA